MNKIGFVIMLMLIGGIAILVQGSDYSVDTDSTPTDQEKLSNLGAVPFLGQNPEEPNAKSSVQTKTTSASKSQDNTNDQTTKNSTNIEQGQGSNLSTQPENKEDLIRGY